MPHEQIVDVLGVFDESFRAEDRPLWYAEARKIIGMVRRNFKRLDNDFLVI